jgi:hypothetical protein
MKTKLVLFFLLLFVAFSIESVAYEIGLPINSSEVEIFVEYENSEKDSEKEALISASFFYASMYFSSVLPSSIFLNNFLCKNIAYKPPIS